jgi:transposase-like protein
VDVIHHSVWLYFRFSLSFRDVEELLAQSGNEVSYETIRYWTIKFGPLIARRLKGRRPAPAPAEHGERVETAQASLSQPTGRACDDHY